MPKIGPGYNIPTIAGPWPDLTPLVSEPGPTRLPTYAEAIQAKVGPTLPPPSLMGASNYDPLLTYGTALPPPLLTTTNHN